MHADKVPRTVLLQSKHLLHYHIIPTWPWCPGSLPQGFILRQPWLLWAAFQAWPQDWRTQVAARWQTLFQALWSLGSWQALLLNDPSSQLHFQEDGALLQLTCLIGQASHEDGERGSSPDETQMLENQPLTHCTESNYLLFGCLS